jgi:hypothetical protein
MLDAIVHPHEEVLLNNAGVIESFFNMINSLLTLVKNVAQLQDLKNIVTCSR